LSFEIWLSFGSHFAGQYFILGLINICTKERLWLSLIYE